MGWNAGYTIFEATVIGAYDLGKLDEELLSVLMEPYRDTDIDSGGRRGLLSRDGKDVKTIVCEILGIAMPPMPAGTWEDNEDEWDLYYSLRSDAFWVATQRFGWQ